MDSAPRRDNVIRPEHVELLDSNLRPVEVETAPERGAPLSWLIIGANVAVFFFYNASLGRPPLELAFHPDAGLFWPQVLTHMFAHGGGMHLFGNMLVVYFLGMILEPLYGTPRYGIIYFAAGVIAALVELVMHPWVALIGASGATSALLAMFARHFPTARLLLMGIIPMPAWLLAVAWLGFNLYGQQYITTMPVAFTAHVAGLLAGLVLSLILLPPRFGRRRRRRGRRNLRTY